MRDADNKTCRGYVDAELVDVESPEVPAHIADPTLLEASVGRRVTLVGQLRTCRNPTIIGVEVLAEPRDCGKAVEATGVLRTVVVAASPAVPIDESIGARGAGVYYQLVDPIDGTVAHARAVTP